MKTKNETLHNNNCGQSTCAQVVSPAIDKDTNPVVKDEPTCSCIACVLKTTAIPIYARIDQLLDTAVRMLELLEASIDPPIDLNEQLIDALELKHILKVGDTKFATMKKLFKTYDVDKKPYYLKYEVLEVIRRYEVISKTDNTNS